MIRRWAAAVLATAAICACQIDSYDNGDTRLSYLTAEMVDMHTVAAQQADYAITDEQQRLTFATPFTCTWADKPDTVYRTLLYYDAGAETPRPLSATPTWVLSPMTPERTYPTDPVKFESAWMAADKRYLNLRLGLMTGHPDDNSDAKQSIAVALRHVDTHANGSRTVYLELSHAQNQVPEYYTTTIYASIPTTQFCAGDTIRLTINTYQGPVNKQWVW